MLMSISYPYNSTTITVVFNRSFVRKYIVILLSRKSIFFPEPGHNFNYNQWSTAVKQANPKMKTLLGIPASQSAGEGYEPAGNIKTIYDTIKDLDNFSGKIS